ncbi:flagellar brake protein [Cupriavidus oxalaticus]|uniref:flagellar brake protein n=1 Tax=Cupriavidus oxalaticus TaxID=96344 RepID=UPI003174C7B8
MDLFDSDRIHCVVPTILSEGQKLVQSHDSIDPWRVSLALQDLAWLKCEGRLYGQGGYAITTMLLEINPVARRYILEGCRTPAERDFLLASGEIIFSASLRGVPIRFSVTNPRTIRFRGGLACQADFPTEFDFVERRQQPRVFIADDVNYTCRLQTPGGQIVELQIDNLSQTGVGLRSTAIGYRELPPGTILHNCSLNLGNHGVIEASLQAVGHGIIRRPEAMFLTGCTFLSLTSWQRTFLQRLIYQFEMASNGHSRP